MWSPTGSEAFSDPWATDPAAGGVDGGGGGGGASDNDNDDDDDRSGDAAASSDVVDPGGVGGTGGGGGVRTTAAAAAMMKSVAMTPTPQRVPATPQTPTPLRSNGGGAGGFDDSGFDAVVIGEGRGGEGVGQASSAAVSSSAAAIVTPNKDDGGIVGGHSRSQWNSTPRSRAFRSLRYRPRTAIAAASPAPAPAPGPPEPPSPLDSYYQSRSGETGVGGADDAQPSAASSSSVSGATVSAASLTPRTPRSHGSPRSPPSPRSPRRGEVGGGGTNSSADSSFDSDLAAASPADALALSRLGPNRTVLKLRRQLDDAQAQSSGAKSALAKSDAVILELRRTVRELRSDLCRAESDRDEARRGLKDTARNAEGVRRGMERQRTRMAGRERQLLELQAQVAGAEGRDELVGELQLKLDRAHAQILTADMKLREREDEYAAKLSELEGRMSEALRRRDAEMEELRAECDELGVRLCGRDEELSAAEERRRDAEERLEEAAEELDEAHRELEMRDDGREAANDRLDERMKEMRRELDRMRAELADKEEEVQSLRETKSSLNRNDLTDDLMMNKSEETIDLSAIAEQTVQTSMLEDREREISLLRSKVEDLSTQLEAARDALDRAAQSGLEDVGRSELRRELEEMTVKFGAAEMELASANMRLHDAERKIAEMESDGIGVDTVSKTELGEVVAERDALQQERDNLIDERDKLTHECLRKLQDNHNVICQALSAADLKEAKAAAGIDDGNALPLSSDADNDGEDPRGSPLAQHLERTSPPRAEERKRQRADADGNDTLTRSSDYRYLTGELRDQLEVAKEEIHKLRAQMKVLEEMGAGRKREAEERMSRSPKDVYDEVLQLRMRLAEHEVRREALEQREASLKDVYEAQRAVQKKEWGLSAVYEAQKKLEGQVEELRKENDLLAEVGEGLSKEKDGLVREKEALTERVEVLEMEKQGVGKERDDLKVSVKKFKVQMEVLESELDEVREKEEGNDLERLKKDKESLSKFNTKLGAEKKDLEAKLSELDGKIETLEAEKAELQKCFDDAMSELEQADDEARTVDDFHKERERLEERTAELRRDLESRDSEIVQLRARLRERDDERLDAASAAARKTVSSRSTSKSPARQRAKERREASERILREQLGQVAGWLDRRGGAGSREDYDSVDAVRLSQSESSETGKDGSGNAVISTHIRMEETEVKLRMAEETLESTRKELEEIRSCPQSNVEAATKRVSELEETVSRLEESLEEERSCVVRLENDLMAAHADVGNKNEVCADLRKSLKEAVGLLKPLKEHVAKSEREKEALQSELKEARSRAEEAEAKQLPPELSVISSMANGSALANTYERQKRVEELETKLRDVTQRLKEKEEEVAELSDEVERLDDALQETHAELVDVREQLAKAAAAAVLTKGSEIALASKQSAKQSSSEEGDSRLRDAQSDLEQARDDLREHETAKRRLKDDLAEAESKLDELTDRHTEVTEERDDLKRQLTELKEELVELEEILSDKSDALQEASERLDTALEKAERAQELEIEAEVLRKSVHGQEEEVLRREGATNQLKEELQRARRCLADIMGDAAGASAEKLLENAAAWKVSNEERIKEVEILRKAVEVSNARVTKLEGELALAKKSLKKKDKLEKVLNKSLKEAVGLLKPLQKHVETAEDEKLELRRKLITASKRAEAAENMSSDHSGSSMDRNNLETSLLRLESDKAELERRVAELEQGKDFSPDDGSRRARSAPRSVRSDGYRQRDDAVRLREQLAEMSSRYDVTKKMLDDAAETNASLLEDLKQTELGEEEARQKAQALQQRLLSAEEELKNAKFIATSALVKVEEMSSVGNGSDHTSPSQRLGANKAGSQPELPTEGGQESNDALQASVLGLREDANLARRKNGALAQTIEEARNSLRSGSRRHRSVNRGAVSSFRQGPRYFG